MPQFDVYRNPDASTRARFPFLLEISPIFSNRWPRGWFSARHRGEDSTPIAQLMPVFEVGGRAS